MNGFQRDVLRRMDDIINILDKMEMGIVAWKLQDKMYHDDTKEELKRIAKK